VACGGRSKSVRQPADTVQPLLVASTDTPGALPSPRPTACPVSSPRFEMTGRLPSPSFGSTLTLLPDGSVLAAGGTGPGFVSLRSAEIWRPSDGTWAQAGAMPEERQFFAAELLKDGRVLVFGGWDRTSVNGAVTTLQSSDLYDPTTDVWSRGPDMNEPRIFPGGRGAVRLTDGRVLAVGGADTATADVLDPNTMVWTPTGPMHAVRDGSATLLKDGRVLAIGGYIDGHGASDGGPTSGEIYDPATNLWIVTAPLPTPEGLSSQLLLRDGRVLVTGGFLNGLGNLPLTLLYDPTTNSWIRRSSITANSQSMIQLDDGRVIVIGADLGSRVTPIYNVVTDSWDESMSMTYARGGPSAIELSDGKVLVVGGRGGNTGSSQAPIGGTYVDPSVVASIPWLDSSELLIPGKPTCGG
jgi:hypothetical protein